MVLVLGVVGAVGDVVVVLDEPLPVVPEELLPLMPEDELPEDGVLLVPPPELEPDLLKCASHSEREIEPSLLLSTAEKLGAEELALALAPALGEVALPDDMLPDAPLDELPCEALGADCEAPLDGVVVVDWELEPVADGAVEEEDEDWATASVESANSTAAVRVPAVLSMDVDPLEVNLDDCVLREANPGPVTGIPRSPGSPLRDA